MIDKLYCKSLLAMPVSDEIKTDAVRQWAKIVTDARHPEQVFEVVPDAIKQEHEDITYVTVRWQKHRYIWATKEEAGVTHVHPTAWGEVIGVME